MVMEFFASKKAGIDLGTANILVYVKGQGIVVNEPSVVARHNRDNAIVAVGNEARAMQGRTPGSISVIRPMRDGVIADYLTTEAMLRYFIGLITGRFNLIRPELMVTVPAGVTSVEQRAVRDASEQAGGRKPAHLVPEPLAAAIGARIPIGTARGNMVVNIGGGRTEAAVISLYGIVVSESVRMAGDRIDEAVMAYVRRRHNLIIGERTAEEIKIAIGSALPIDEGLGTQVRGRDQLSGLPKTISLTSIVSALHANQVIHRDLSAMNVLYSPRGQDVRIIDFGLSTNFPNPSNPAGQSAAGGPEGGNKPGAVAVGRGTPSHISYAWLYLSCVFLCGDFYLSYKIPKRV